MKEEEAMYNKAARESIETARKELKTFWSISNDIEGTRRTGAGPGCQSANTLRQRSPLAVGVVDAVVGIIQNTHEKLHSGIQIDELYKRTRENLGNSILDGLERALND